MLERFVIGKDAKKEDHWVCIDKINNIACQFENGKFNDTCSFGIKRGLEPTNNFGDLTVEMEDWLWENHGDKVLDMQDYDMEAYRDDMEEGDDEDFDDW